MDQYYPSSQGCGKGKLKDIHNYDDSGPNIWVYSVKSPHDRHSNSFHIPGKMLSLQSFSPWEAKQTNTQDRNCMALTRKCGVISGLQKSCVVVKKTGEKH